MKTQIFKIFLSFLGLLLFAFLFTGCDRNVECLAPPPSISFQIKDGALTYPADLDTAARINVSYIENNQEKFVESIRKKGDQLSAVMLIQTSRVANDPEFLFKLNDRLLAKVKLETYNKPTKCDSWSKVSKVYQNGEEVLRSSNWVYALK